MQIKLCKLYNLFYIKCNLLNFCEFKGGEEEGGDTFGIVVTDEFVDIVGVGAVPIGITAKAGYSTAVDERTGTVFIRTTRPAITCSASALYSSGRTPRRTPFAMPKQYIAEQVDSR